jgi:hypothetical protein
MHFVLLVQLDANFLKVVSSAIVDKYIGESARLIREMFNYARDHQVGCRLTGDPFVTLPQGSNFDPRGEFCPTK